MALVTLKIPPGVYANGTEYQAASRWLTADLCRWFEDSMRPIGGWQTMSSTQFADVARGMHAYYDNSNARRIIVGTTSNLYVYDEGKNQSDITPVGLAAGNTDATASTAYGSQFYGEHAYGVPRPDSGSTYTPATTWSIDNFGENTICCNTTDGKVYEWANSTGSVAAVLSNAPTSNQGVLVTDERFVMCYGSDGNPRKVSWSSQEASNVWTPSSSNTAGSLEIASDGQIRSAIVVRGQILVLTDSDAHTLTYAGSPFYFTQEAAGKNCGIVSAKAVAVTGTTAYWMGERGFFSYDGGYTTPLKSDVSDYVFGRLNTTQRSKVCAVINGNFNEVWWFYPSSSGTENDSYVLYNFAENYWSIGSIARTAGVDAGVFTNPVWASTDRYIYEHESGFSWGGATPFAESGAISIGDGERLVNVKGLIPDESNLGDTKVIFKSRLYPTGTETTSAAFTMANPTAVRLTARQVRLRIESNSASDWRYGNLRLEIGQGGKR